MKTCEHHLVDPEPYMEKLCEVYFAVHAKHVVKADYSGTNAELEGYRRVIRNFLKHRTAEADRILTS